MEKSKRAYCDLHFKFSTLNKIAYGFSPITGTDDCYRAILEGLKKIIPYDTSTLFLSSGDTIRAVAAAGFSSEEEKEVLQLTFNLHNKSLREMHEIKEPILVNDVQEREYLIGGVGVERIRSWIGIPLFLRENFVGVVTVDKYESDFYTEEDVELARNFSVAAAIAIYNTLLYSRRQTMLDASIALIQSTSLKVSLQKILEEAMKLIGGSEGTIMLLDESKDNMKIVASKGIIEEGIEELNRKGIPANIGTFEQSVKQKKVVEIEDTYNDPRVARGFGYIPPKLLNIPLIAGDEVLGVLTLDALPRNEEERRLLIYFGKVAGSVIKHFDLLDRYKELTVDLTLISEVAKNISSLTEIEDLFKKTADLIKEHFKVFYVSIFILDKDKKELLYKWGSGFDWESLKDTFKLYLGGPGIIVWVVENERPLLVNDVSKDTRYFRVEETQRVKSELAVPIKVKGEVIGVLDLESEIINGFRNDDVIIFQALADQLGVVLENASLYEGVKKLAITDGLTGLYNHRRFYEFLEEEILRFKRYNGCLSILFMDIDGFKKYNDTYGHLEGDKLLKKVAEITLNNVRKVDKVARYGGDEFAILLPHTHCEKAYLVALRLREGFLKENIQVSIGMVAMSDEEFHSKEDLLKAADEALYEAKRTGVGIKRWNK